MRTEPILGARAHGDVALARRVPHRVLDEVRDHLVQAFGVGIEREVIGFDRDRQADVAGVQPGLAHRELEHRRDLEDPPVEGNAARFEAREVEELLHQPAEPLDLGEHGAERLGVGRLDAVDEVLQHRLQRGDRRPQLVADVGDEVPAQAVGLGELGCHLVEGTGERSDLVARGDGDALTEVAARHCLTGRDHLAQGRSHPAREEPHDGERECTRDDPADRRPYADAHAGPEHDRP